MIAWYILGIAYFIALPFVFIVMPEVKKEMGWNSINIMEFLSIWLIMPVFLIIKLIYK